MDASKRPITVLNMEIAFSAFFTMMGLLLASTSTKSCTFVAVSEADVDASKSPSQWRT